MQRPSEQTRIVARWCATLTMLVGLTGCEGKSVDGEAGEIPMAEVPDLPSEEAVEALPPPKETTPETAFPSPARWPVENVHLTSYFGWRTDPVSGRGLRLHRGIDLRGKKGDLVMTIAEGTVRFVGHDPLLGNLVIVDHGDGVESFYGHLSDVLVHESLPIERGAAIGLVGNTGRSAAPHLHLTIKVGGVSVDPLLVLGQPLHRAPGLSIERPKTP